MKIYVWLVVVLAGITQQVAAGTIEFVNGDRLQGEVVSMEGGKLTFKSEIFGEITIPSESIASFSTDKVAEIHFKDGTVLRRQVAASRAGIALDEGAVIAAQSIPIAEINTINPPPPEPIAWAGQIVAGLSIKQGNTESQDAHTDIEALRETDQDRIRLEAEYIENKVTNLETDEENTTKRRYALAANYDYFIGSGTYAYGNFSAEKEVTANLDLRMTSGAGFGYRWLNNDRARFDTDIGLSWVTENFSDESVDEDYLASRIGWRYEYLFYSTVRLYHHGEWFASFDDGDDFIVKTETGVRSRLNETLFTEAKVVFDWDNTPAQGAEREDITYMLGVGWDF